MKLKLVALIIGIGMMLWASAGTAGVGITSGGDTVYVSDPIIPGPSPAQEKRDKQRFEWQKEDRQNKKKMQEEQKEQEIKAQDARRESAYAESKAAHKSKVNKMRKRAGMKPHNSWQLNH